MLLPLGVLHTFIFLLCTLTAIYYVRVCCLSPGQPSLRDIPKRKLTDNAAGEAEIGINSRPVIPTLWVGARYTVNPSSTVNEPRVTWDRHRLDDRRAQASSHLLEPIREPVLLWKEIYQGAFIGPGPSLAEWRRSLWRPAAFVLAVMALSSSAWFYIAPDRWYEGVISLNHVLRLLTVVLAALTCGCLGFRCASSVCRERQRQTLDGLLTLPVDWIDILRAKWLGALLRYRLGMYALITVWGLGLACGAIHPLGILLLAVVCAAHFVFLISFGLWLSLVSRNSLWANMRMATLFLVFCCSALVGLFDNHLRNESSTVGNAVWFLDLTLCPERSWWLLEFPWFDSTGKQIVNAALVRQAFCSALMETVLFGGAAFLFWRLARRRMGGVSNPKSTSALVAAMP
jgi:hypothetical protein